MSQPLFIAHAELSLDRGKVLNDLSMELGAGKIGCLLGSSGGGKTSLLRSIAGFQNLDSGEIRIGDRRVFGDGINVPAEKRRVGMVFQDYALLPHLSVRRNVTFGLQQLSRKEKNRQADELMEAVGITDLADERPASLSGGQQQRVALIRALAPNPQLILLDEPFSSLDAELRERIAGDVRELLKSRGTTALMVTHDQLEAFALADEIGLLHEGKIAQWGSAYELYHRPINRYVAGFIGQGVLVPATQNSDGSVDMELGHLVNPEVKPGEAFNSGDVDLLLRPDDVLHDDDSLMTAEVLAKAFRGAEILYSLRLPSGRQALALVPSHHNHKIGEPIGIRLEVDHVVTFPRKTP